MNQKPVLVIMAAGMGSRYGGLKQIDPMDSFGNMIVDFSVYDALEAGFEKVVFIIKKSIEQDFKQHIGNRISRHIQVEYVFQELEKLPEGYGLFGGRVKPWGTGHAILCCKGVISGPFAVINADDYYGKSAFQSILKQLMVRRDNERFQYTMVGYQLYNTLTNHGSVARGVCMMDQENHLTGIHERTNIEKHGENAEYTEDGGRSWHPLSRDTIVSMNMWGFTESILNELEVRFQKFLDEELQTDPEKCEFFLPFVVDELLQEGKAEVLVEKSMDVWHGVTYKEDKAEVVKAIQEYKKKGLYPDDLWNETGKTK